VDFVFHGDLPSVIVRSTGIKTRYLMPLYARSNIYVAVPAGSQIKSLTDLKGKVVSNFRGTATQLVANRVLSSVGLAERDMRLVSLDTAGVNAALATGQIDAAFCMLTTFGLKDKNLIRYVFSSNFQPRFSAVGGLLVTDDFARKYPQSVDRFVKAIVQERFGPPDSLRLVAADTPEIGAGEVLLEVHAAAVNPYDWHMLRGDPRIARLMGGVGVTRPKARIAGVLTCRRLARRPC